VYKLIDLLTYLLTYFNVEILHHAKYVLTDARMTRKHKLPIVGDEG